MQILRRKLVFLLLATVLLTVGPFLDASAQTAKLPRVAVLTMMSPQRPAWKGLLDGLQAEGYVVGENLSLNIEQKKDFTELESAARRFVANRVDVLVTSGNRETAILQQATAKIPIVFMTASGPLKLGFVQSHAKPGTNLTGLSYFRDTEDSGKLMELLKELAPNLESVTLLSDGRGSPKLFADQGASIRKVARKLNVRIAEKFPRDIDEVFAIVSGLSSGRHQGVLLNCTTLFANLKRTASGAKEIGVALQGCAAPHVIQDGALFSYSPDLYQIGRRGAWYVDRILKGAKPQDMPIEAPREFEFAVNLNTARAIGLNLPPVVLQRADRVIE